jgi:hypothetical protein
MVKAARGQTASLGKSFCRPKRQNRNQKQHWPREGQRGREQPLRSDHFESHNLDVVGASDGGGKFLPQMHAVSRTTGMAPTFTLQPMTAIYAPCCCHRTHITARSCHLITRNMRHRHLTADKPVTLHTMLSSYTPRSFLSSYYPKYCYPVILHPPRHTVTLQPNSVILPPTLVTPTPLTKFLSSFAP